MLGLKMSMPTMDCPGLLFIIETTVIVILLLIALIVWICKCLGYVHIYCCPSRRHQNYMDLDKDIERDTSTQNRRQEDDWTKERLSRLKEIEEPYKKQTSEIQNLQEKLKKVTEEKEKEKAEKDDALKRLSAIMSSRLRDGNPNVADLNDQNRPVKLGEQFSELYDNQWTDAFGAIEICLGQEKNEAKAISFLLELLEQCFRCCKDKADQELKQLNDDVQKLALAVTKKNTTLAEDIMQRVKEERKLYSMDGLPDYNECVTAIKRHFSEKEIESNFLADPTVKTFAEDCLKLCWLMVIQDPPMSMVQKPSENVHEVFRAYTHRGKLVSFVVWPALLLQEGGPLISKGIAEFHD